ncbi:MAG: TauD/TfdA family dioxygenase [Chitinophagales bacterium]
MIQGKMETNTLKEKDKLNFRYFDEEISLPLVAEAKEDKSKAALIEWIDQNKEFIDKQIYKDGAILFRGFDINTAQDFEDVAIKIDPDLKNNYLGTSPRNSVTKYVFSASELPSHYPIMQHCEMSFLPNPPRKLFFFCETQPELGGETPIVNFRKVYEQMDPEIRQEFETRGIKNIRNYNGPNSKSKFDLWKLKRWDEMFLTDDKNVAEEKSKENGLEVIWKDNDKLRLINDQEACITHPVTGEKVWFNHLQVFHRSAAAIEYKKIHKLQGNLRSFFYNNFISIMTFFKEKFSSPMEQAMHCTFKDGSEIPRAYVEHVEDLIWKNMSVFPWKKGDVVAIDNYSTSHGRLPYVGDRNILVSWSAE